MIILPILIVLAQGPAATTRTLTVDDLFRIQRVSDPRVSPDGKWVAYVVATPDLAADKFDIAMSGMGRTLDRARVATFSKPYMRYGKLLLIRSADQGRFKTLADVMAAAKAAPGKLTFGSGGQGTVQYMAPELMNQSAGVSMLHIPYKSGGLAITATLASEVDMGFFNLPAISGHVKSGLVKALAITSAQRNPLFPDVPTVAEVIGKPYESYEWNGVFVPRGTPSEVVTRLHAALREVLNTPEIKAKFDSLGSRIVASSPDEFRKYLNAESQRWASTVKAAGIKKE